MHYKVPSSPAEIGEQYDGIIQRNDRMTLLRTLPLLALTSGAIIADVNTAGRTNPVYSRNPAPIVRSIDAGHLEGAATPTNKRPWDLVDYAKWGSLAVALVSLGRGIYRNGVLEDEKAEAVSNFRRPVSMPKEDLVKRIEETSSQRRLGQYDRLIDMATIGATAAFAISYFVNGSSELTSNSSNMSLVGMLLSASAGVVAKILLESRLRLEGSLYRAETPSSIKQTSLSPVSGPIETTVEESHRVAETT